MNAVVVVCHNKQAAALLAADLHKNVGCVVRYCKGRRLTGGVRHIAEGWLRRQYPEYLLQPQVLFLPVKADIAHDVLDETLSMVVRQENPAEYEVRLVDLGNAKAMLIAGTSGD